MSEAFICPHFGLNTINAKQGALSFDYKDRNMRTQYVGEAQPISRRY